MYFIGEGRNKDYLKAIYLLAYPANKGDSLTQGTLGTIYLQEDNNDKYYNKAKKWLKKRHLKRIQKLSIG